MVVGGGFGILQNRRYLLEMRFSQHKRAVVEGLSGKKGEGRRIDLENLLVLEHRQGHAFLGKETVFGVFRAELKKVLVGERGRFHGMRLVALSTVLKQKSYLERGDV